MQATWRDHINIAGIIDMLVSLVEGNGAVVEF